MRKDVKLGFAIGGILLAVLIVYVLVVPGEKSAPQAKGPSAEPVAVTGTNSSNDQAKSAPPTVLRTPTTGPDVFAPPKPGDPAAKADTQWNKLLDGDVSLAAAVGNSTATPPKVETTSRVVGESLAPPTTQHALAAASRTHVVREGENLSSIAAAAYGSAKYYPQIQQANPGLDPTKLRVGQTINLPDVADVKREGLGAAASSSGTVAINSANEYRVVAGDSLYKISVKLYGKSDRQTKIYELNKSTIGGDPEKLKVGTVLKLPEAPTVQTR